MKSQILAQSGGARRAAAHPSAVQRAAGESAFAAANIRNSPRMVAQRRQQQSLFGNLAQPKRKEELRGESSTTQRIKREEENPLQRKPAPEPTAQAREVAPDASRTGLPANLKYGIESLSGISLDNVQVHYNSAKPAQLNALAYAQGTDIHVAPGQQKHLPHEAWHVVQQAQGRVRPTMQMKGGVPVSDEKALEDEADVMGARAARTSPPLGLDSPDSGRAGLATQRSSGRESTSGSSAMFPAPTQFSLGGSRAAVVQRGGSGVLKPGTEQQLSITYTDGFDRDVQDDPYAFLALSDDFDSAATGLTDLKLAADKNYERSFDLSSTKFKYSCYWDKGSRRLVVRQAEYIGHGPLPDFMLPGAVLRQKTSKVTGIGNADLPSIDWLSQNMGWNLAEVKVTTSSEAVITFIPPGDSVVQYYKGTESYTKTIKTLGSLAGSDIAGVASARPLGDSRLRLLQVEKLEALNLLSDVGEDSPRKQYVAKNAKTIFIETRKAILNMAAKGMSQGDVSIDNLGVRSGTGAYALFDFNLAGPASPETIMRDLSSLVRSLKFYGVKVPSEYEKNPQAKGSWD